MKKGLIIVLIIAITAAVASGLAPKVQTPTPPISSDSSLLSLTDLDSINLKYKEKVINLEVARSESKQQQGLMNRTELSEDSGMIFIFDKESQQTFWMMNTLISLDIIYLNKDMKVVSIAKSTKTNQTEEVYPSNFPAQFVVEMNGGWSQKNDLKVGENFEIL